MNEHVDNSEPTSRSAFRLLAKRAGATNRDADNLRKALLAQWNERSGAHRLELKLQQIDATDAEARLAMWFSLSDPGNGQLVAADDRLLDNISEELRATLAAAARPAAAVTDADTAGDDD